MHTHPKPISLATLTALFASTLLVAAPVRAEDSDADTAAPPPAEAAPAEAAAPAPAGVGNPDTDGDGKLSGLEIARHADRVASAATEHQIMTMTLENKRGQTRVRTIEGWSREISEDEEHRFSLFLEPSDVKDTTLLSYDYDSKNDDTWLFLPALKKVKRILSTNKDDYFMGSDFTYEDMENLDLINKDYTLVGEETLDGLDCYVVEATPNNDEERAESGYTKTRSWIAKTDFLPRRVDFTDKKDRLSKRLTAEEVKMIGDNPPRPRAHKVTMENFITEHKTILALKELTLDVEIPEKVFSQRNLRQ